MRHFGFLCSVCALLAALPVADVSAAAAKKATKQSAIQSGTKVRTKTDASGLYDQECYDAYYGCMDQFCISENENGGSCACSDLSLQYDKQFLEIQEILAEADRISTEEVEKVKAGANADIVFTGKREYDDDGNLVDVDDIGKNDKSKKRADLLSLWDENVEEDEEEFGNTIGNIADLTGAALYKAAEELCLDQVPDSCESDLPLLQSCAGIRELSC